MIRTQNTKLGALFACISSLAFALMSVFVKEIGPALPTSMLIFVRFAISLILLLPFIVVAKDFSFKIEHPFRYLLRILASLFALFCLFYALKFIPLVDALLLNNTAPLFVPIIAWLMTGAKTPHKAAMGIGVGFLGIAIILQPGQEIFSFAASLALLAGVLAALAIVQMRLISKSSSTLQMMFYYFAVSTLISGIFAIAQWQTPVDVNMWLLLLVMGIFGTLYQVFATLSYTIAPVRLMSPITFMGVVFGGFFDWLIWGNSPNLLTIVGALFVIVGAMITVYFGQKEIALQQSK